MNASLHLVSMEHAQIYLMTTIAHAMQGILVEIVQYRQRLQILATHTLASMEPPALKTLAPMPVVVPLATLEHFVKQTSMSA